MKKQILILAGLFATVFMVSCGNSSNKEAQNADSTTGSIDSSKALTSTRGKDTTMIKQPVDQAASKFAVDAARGGLMEVALGKIAKEKGTDKRVQDFGEMMVNEHTKLNDKLKEVAVSQDVTLPDSITVKDQKEISKLEKKTGKEFDKKYIDMMISDHKKDLEDFQKASDKLTNPALKGFALDALPVLEKHLDSAKAIAGSR